MATDGAGDEQKRRAAVRAAEWIEDGMAVGLGTGSTVRFLLEEIAARRARGELAALVGVPTSEDTARRCRELDIPLATLEQYPRLHLAIDGADEVDPRLDLVKGLGGALLREKIVAVASAVRVIIVDGSKRVPRLGTRAPVPVEVEPFGHTVLPDFFASLGARAELRRGADGEPYLTDGGNFIYHCHFPDGVEDPAALDVALNARAGVVENGLFVGIADRVVVAGAGGIEILSRPGREG